MKKFLMILCTFLCINVFAVSDPSYNFNYRSIAFEHLGFQTYNKGSYDGIIGLYSAKYFNAKNKALFSYWLLKPTYDGEVFFCLYPDNYFQLGMRNPQNAMIDSSQINQLIGTKFDQQMGGGFKDHYSLVPFLNYPTLSNYLSQTPITKLDADSIVLHTQQAIESTADKIRSSPYCNQIFREAPYISDLNLNNFLINPLTGEIYPIDFGEMSPQFPVEEFEDFKSEIYSHVANVIKK